MAQKRGAKNPRAPTAHEHPRAARRIRRREERVAAKLKAAELREVQDWRENKAAYRAEAERARTYERNRPAPGRELVELSPHHQGFWEV